MHLLFLYGPPASGKYTIARIIAEQTGLPLFHNHLIVDAVAAVFPFGSANFIRLRIDTEHTDADTAAREIVAHLSFQA